MGRPFLGLLLLGALAVAGEDRDRVAREVLAQLEQRDVGDWARELARTPIPKAGPDCLRRYMVYLRAGHLDRLPAVLDVLAGLDKMWREYVVYQLLERGAIDTARHAAERFPDPDHADRFLSRWKVDDATKGKWIAARYKSYPKAWFWRWFEWEAAHGRGKPILDRLERELRANPGDYRRARSYLGARSKLKLDKIPAWFGEVVRPRLAFESNELAESFWPGRPQLALVYFERSLAQPYTEEDDRYLRMRLSLYDGGPTPEEHLRACTKRRLIEGYLKTGQAKKAQALLNELAKEYPDGVPPFGELAGMVQRFDVERTIEKNIRKATKRDASYWRTRANYYVGRKMDAEARTAYRKWIELAPETGRGNAVTAFAHYLRSTGHPGESKELLLDAFAAAKPGSQYASYLLAYMPVDAHNESIWLHLAKMERWSSPEGRALLALAQAAADRRQVWDRAGKLTKGTNPSRSATLADAMRRNKEPLLAIPYLRDAMKRKTDYSRVWIRDDLFRIYIDHDDWRAALALKAPMEPHRRAVLARAAARAGDTKEATAFWAELVRRDRLHHHDYIPGLAKAVGRKRLRAFYSDLEQRDPDLRIPAALYARIQSE